VTIDQTASLLWLLPGLPLVGAVVLLISGRASDRWGHLLGTALAVASFVLGLVMFVGMVSRSADERAVTETLFTWVPVGELNVDFGFQLDQLSMCFVLLITGVGSLIHVYSIGYMHDDPDRRRFFAYLNLFLAAMLVLVLADNYLGLYLGWEGVGLASYLLIGFWQYKPSAATAAKKAFVVNRVGDIGLAIGLMIMFATFGAVSFTAVFDGAGQAGESTLTALGFMLLLAACGKSAQVPLQSWLGDAMEGPTPVSALIHAATMVTAGVYMVVRMSPLFELATVAGANVMLVVAWVGGLTALMGATIALTKTDLKRILAYSTVSQLGFMFMAVGVGSYVAGMFHLTTHAFFKACLFLGAGAVMHAMHGELDINKMGGLKAKMRSTYWTFLIAAAALAGFPLTAGFFSKDAVLVADFEAHQYLLYAVGLFTALLTAIYAFKMVFVVFWGQPRDRKLYEHAHEQPRLMTWPLWILAFLSIFGGLLNLPFIATLEHWIEPIYQMGPEGVTAHPSVALEITLLTLSALAALGGIYLAYYFYVKNPGVTDRLRERMALLHRVAANSFYFDAAYDAIRRGLWATAHFCAAAIDQGGIDAAVNGVARGAGWLGERTRRVQTGLVGVYALTMFVGLVILLAYFLVSGVLK